MRARGAAAGVSLTAPLRHPGHWLPNSTSAAPRRTTAEARTRRPRAAPRSDRGGGSRRPPRPSAPPSAWPSSRATPTAGAALIASPSSPALGMYRPTRPASAWRAPQRRRARQRPAWRRAARAASRSVARSSSARRLSGPSPPPARGLPAAPGVERGQAGERRAARLRRLAYQGIGSSSSSSRPSTRDNEAREQRRAVGLDVDVDQPRPRRRSGRPRPQQRPSRGLGGPTTPRPDSPLRPRRRRRRRAVAAAVRRRENAAAAAAATRASLADAAHAPPTPLSWPSPPSAVCRAAARRRWAAVAQHHSVAGSEVEAFTFDDHVDLAAARAGPARAAPLRPAAPSSLQLVARDRPAGRGQAVDDTLHLRSMRACERLARRHGNTQLYPACPAVALARSAAPAARAGEHRARMARFETPDAAPRMERHGHARRLRATPRPCCRARLTRWRLSSQIEPAAIAALAVGRGRVADIQPHASAMHQARAVPGGARRHCCAAARQLDLHAQRGRRRCVQAAQSGGHGGKRRRSSASGWPRSAWPCLREARSQLAS